MTSYNAILMCAPDRSHIILTYNVKVTS